MQAIATITAHRAIQLPGIMVRPSDKLLQIQRNVQRTYANEVRDSILRCTRQMSGTQSHNRRVNFLSGLDVCEITMDAWVKANEAYQPVWFG